MTQDKDGKKDLTRIEDLGSFFHEEEEDQEEAIEPISEDIFVTDSSDDNLPPPFEEEAADSIFEPDSNNLTFTSESDESNEINWGDETLENEFAVESERETETEPVQETEQENELESAFEFGSDFETETQPIAPAEEISKSPEYVDPLSEIKNFAKNVDLSNLPAEANPAFSLILENIRFEEDAQEILNELKSIELFADHLSSFEKSMKRGTVLIPRMNEFLALHLLHRLRRFPINIKMGLSDLIHPSRQLEPDLGLITKSSLTQKQSHYFNFQKTQNINKNVILTTSSSVDHYEISSYLGIVTESVFVTSDLVENDQVEDLMNIYESLSEKLRPKAHEKNADAVIGISYQLNPIKDQYKIICSGNLVTLNKV